MRLEDDAILHAIGALVWGIGLGAVAIAPTFPPFPLQRRAVAQPAKHAPKGRRGAVPGANQASISAVRYLGLPLVVRIYPDISTTCLQASPKKATSFLCSANDIIPAGRVALDVRTVGVPFEHIKGGTRGRVGDEPA